MSQAIQAICTATMNALTPIAGLATLLTEPKDVLAGHDFPLILIYPGTGRWRWGSLDDGEGHQRREGLHTITIDLHAKLSNAKLDEVMLIARPYCDSVPDALFRAAMTDRLEGTIANLGDPDSSGSYPIRWEFASFGWGSTETLGVRFAMDVWVEEEITL